MRDFILKLSRDFAIGSISGLISGILSSILVFQYISTIEPELEISKYIAKTDYKGNTYYEFKFVNRSSRTILDIKSELVTVTQNEFRQGPTQYISKIKMDEGEILNIEPFDKTNQRGGYTGRISTTSDLEKILAKDGVELRLSIVAKDSLSGVTKVFEQNFANKDSIKPGLHDFGESLEVSQSRSTPTSQ
ncbi:hypothetical protein D9M71_125160 [compost metagenome]